MSVPSRILVYWLDLDSFPTGRIKGIFKLLNTEDRRRSSAFLKENDRLRFFGGRYLLNEYLNEFSDCESLDQLRPDEFKRPCLQKTSFSISHSENLVVLAAGSSDISLGIDLEVCTPRYVPDYLEPFCEEERNYILHDHALSRFYEAWTKKESALKAIGKGFLHEAGLINTMNRWFKHDDIQYSWLRLEAPTDVISHLCHDQKEIEPEIRRVSG